MTISCDLLLFFAVFYIPISVFISSPLTVTADAILGCGGFVEASSALIKSRNPSDSKLDYSHISVELCTVDGLVKDRTLCAPNGYYFIPVYDKGSFVLRVKGPDGWSWKPEKSPVTIDQNGCNGNEDINFQFTGFTISGNVRGAVGSGSCTLKDGGPSGVKVELLSLSDDLIASTLTPAAGNYSFTNILPGKYKLHASHPNLEIQLRGSPEVNLGFGNSLVDDIFFVSGYDLNGFVVAQGNPILGVNVYLYSDDVLEVHCPESIGDSPIQKPPLCRAISDENGKFMFKSLPCGAYELLPFYKGENTIFDVSPPSMVVMIEHNHVTLGQKFQVTGFSIGGRVTDDHGLGVDGAKIIVDGNLRSVTEAQGFYKLDQVSSKEYSITAEKDHYKFNKLDNYMVLPNMARIDDIRAVYYDICGTVQLITTESKAMVLLTHGPENFKPQKKVLDESGRFCFEVPSGEYRLSVQALESDSSSIMFSPLFVDVNVKSPLLNIEFFQAQVGVRGTVLCKERCSPDISVSLLGLMGHSTQERKTVALKHDNCDFLFSKIFPGKYRLEVKHTSPLSPEEDNWCWEHDAIDVDVGTEDLTGVVFVQRGYWVNIISTHKADAYIEKPDFSRVDISVKKGSQKICMETPGQHVLHFVNSCVSFGSSSVEFDPLSPSPLYLTGKKYLLKGEIHIDSDLIRDAVDLSEHIVVDTFNRDGLLETIGTLFVYVSSNSRNKGVAIYEYSIWSELGDEFTFVPRDTRTSEEKRIIFYPKQRKVSANVNGCQATISPIIGRVGLYIQGSVNPAQEGVQIKVLAMGSSKYATLREGDIAFETETGLDGSYSAGPLYDDISYKADASKPSYYLKQVGPGSFTCQKLSQIVVHIYDGKQDGELFPPVLLSLSGEDGYRNNSVSSSGGTFSFEGLFPGSFYLRPLLKEYSFSPAAVAIELESGDSKAVTFLATRVAYSATGSVSLLSGQPKEGIYVEARSEMKGFYEEATTDNLGNFRLRGLLPDTAYLVRVVTKDYRGVKALERASPESITIMVGSEDLRGLDFIVFEQPDTTILSANVEGDELDKLQPHLSVEVRLASDPSKIELIFPLPLSHYFEVRDLPKGKHLVQLRSGLSTNSNRFQSEVLEVDLEKHPQTHAGPLRYKVLEDNLKQDITPAPLFPLIAGVTVIALFISMPRLKDLYQLALGTSRWGPNSVFPKKEVRKKKLH